MGTLSIERINKTITTGEGFFDCGNTTINNLIKNSFLPTLYKHAYAYEVSIDNSVVGYYMLIFSRHKLEDAPEEISDYVDSMISNYFSVKIKYLALDKYSQKLGLGADIIKIIIQQVRQLSDRWPVRTISLDALCDKIDWYKKMGFKLYDNSKCIGDNTTELMFIDFIDNPDKLSKYI